MTTAAPISYGSDYGADQTSIDRARKYAEMLQQQGMQGAGPTQVINGWAVPQGKSAGIAQMLQMVGGVIGNKLADQKEKDLATKYQTDLANTLRDATAAQAGTPARPANTDIMQGNQNLDSFDSNPAQAAVAGDPMKAASIYMRHPATQPMGLQMIQQGNKAQELAALLNGGPPGAPSQDASAAPVAPPTGPQGGALPPGPITPATMQQMPMQARSGLLSQLSGPDQQLAAGYARAGDQAGLMKLLDDRLKPHVTADGKAITTIGGKVQVLPGSVDAMQQYANVLDPQKIQQMDQSAMTMYQSKGVDLPGYRNGQRIPGTMPGQQQGGGMPGYVGPTAGGRFEGDPNALMQQIQNIPDPNDRAGAMAALKNQIGGQTPEMNARAARAGTPAMLGSGIPVGAGPGASPTPVGAPAAPSNLSPDQLRELEASNRSKFEGGRATNMVEYEKGLNSRVTEGSNLNMRMQQSIEALDKFRAGGGAETYQKLAQVAQGLGMPSDVVNGLMGGGPGALAASQVFNKLAAQEAMETLKQSMGGAGRIAQAEFKVFQQNNPNISTDPDAIRKIFDFNTRVYNSDLAEQNAFGKFVKTNNPAEFPAYWAQQSAKQGFTNPQLSATPTPQRRESDKQTPSPVRRFNPATGKIE